MGREQPKAAACGSPGTRLHHHAAAWTKAWPALEPGAAWVSHSGQDGQLLSGDELYVPTLGCQSWGQRSRPHRGDSRAVICSWVCPTGESFPRHQTPWPPEMAPGCWSCTHPLPRPGRVPGHGFAPPQLAPAAASDPTAAALRVSPVLAEGSGTHPAGVSHSMGRRRGRTLARELLLPRSGGWEGEARRRW